MSDSHSDLPEADKPAIGVPKVADNPRLALHWFQKIIRGGEGVSVLVCDTCGAIFPDDHDSDIESCHCGRFKQRMEYANVKDVVRYAASVLSEALGPQLDFAEMGGHIEVSSGGQG